MGKSARAPTALERLINEPKGKIDYAPGEAFLLQVFWEAPNMSAARQLLDGLKQCAHATHRDTPCVPSYFFRISNNDADLCGPPPKTVSEYPQLRAAIKKLKVGIPRPAVVADLIRCGLDPDLLDLDMDAELPPSLRDQQPVALEFTELYLDERAFMEHAGSRDYLDGYGVVMRPAVQNRPPYTIRLGTPPASIAEKILEPILKEVVVPLAEGCMVWKRPSKSGEGALMLSVDFDTRNGCCEAALPTALFDYCTMCVTFAHPRRDYTTRLLCVLPSLPPHGVLSSLAVLHPVRGEAYVTSGDETTAKVVRDALTGSGLGVVTVNARECVGYVLHERAAELNFSNTR
ncbi:unnamed protein product [Calypogeia fissa]